MSKSVKVGSVDDLPIEWEDGDSHYQLLTKPVRTIDIHLSTIGTGFGDGEIIGGKKVAGSSDSPQCIVVVKTPK